MSEKRKGNPAWEPGKSGNPATQFKAGEKSANPKGRGKENPQKKAIKQLTQKKLLQLANKILNQDYSSLEKLLKKVADGGQRETSSPLELLVASCVLKAIQKGDINTLEKLLDRMIGKVSDRLKIEGNSGPRVVISFPDNGRDNKNGN